MVSAEAVWLQAGWLFQEVVSGEVWWRQESLGWFQEKLRGFRKSCVVSGKAAWFQEAKVCVAYDVGSLMVKG